MSFRSLNERQARFFRAFLEVVVPGAGDDVVAAADAMVSTKPEAIQKKTKLFMMVVTVLPIFRFFRTFPNLSVEKRERVLRWLAGGPIGVFRLGFWGLRSLALLAYYGDEGSWKRLEYGGPKVERPRRRDLPVDPYEVSGGA